MKYNPDKHHRHSIRLQGYDYSSEGAYFVTICVKDRECLFGEIQNEQMVLNEYGKIVEQCWLNLPNHYHNIVLDEYIVMPNHFHGIIFIVDNVWAIHESPLQPQTLQQQTLQQLQPQPPDTEAIHELPLHKLPLHKLPLHKLPLHESSLQLSLQSPQQSPAGAIHELPLQKSPQQRRKMLLPKIIGQFKMNSAKQINQIRNMPGVPVWQRNYYEHIIRNEESLNNIRKYIINNPSKWFNDEYNSKMDKNDKKKEKQYARRYNL